MQQSEILSLVERLIPVYGAPDFDEVLETLTIDAPPSAKVIAKMELKRIMTPCVKAIDLRGKVQGECREYELDGRTHWLDDVALNSYHRKIKRFGGYTEGVWEALVNTRNNNRVLHQSTKNRQGESSSSTDNQLTVEPIHLGYSLKRQEKRLRMTSLVNITLSNGQQINATSSDISTSGLKLKIPSAFEIDLGDTFKAVFTELFENTNIDELTAEINYRIIGIDENYENDSIRWVRAIRLTDTDAITQAINVTLDSYAKKSNHDNQDKVLRARTHTYENAHIRHTTALPLFFNNTELKYALLNENNLETWEYWHDERNLQSLTSLFNPGRMAELTKSGVKASNNVIYAFAHEHQGKRLHYSMMLPEASREERQLFWHMGARRKSWKVYRLNMFELDSEEAVNIINSTPEYETQKLEFTHLGMLQEISGCDTRRDYLLTEKPNIDPGQLNRFRHPRKSPGSPKGVYFDAISRRKEPRFNFLSPVEIILTDGQTTNGDTINFSCQGVSIRLKTPLTPARGELIQVSFTELQLYDKSVPLTKVPYQVVRISADGRNVQLKIEESSQTTKTVQFLRKLISHNRKKLTQIPEQIPGVDLLDAMYDIILTRLVSTPVYIAKSKQAYRPVSIGVNFPLQLHLKMFDDKNNRGRFSVESIFRNRSSRLLKEPLRPVAIPQPTYHEIYFAVIKNSLGNTETIHSRIESEFKSLKERILFIKKAKQMGEFYAFRFMALPVKTDKPEVLRQKIRSISNITAQHARSLEKEIRSLAGYCELVNITDEVLVRLELT